MESKLLTKTLEMLEEKLKTHSIKEISSLSGLPEPGLKSLRKPKKIIPAVNRVEKLYEFLSKKTLKV